MSFPNVPKDPSQIPFSSLYIPGTGWVALQGVAPTTDGLGNTSAPVAFSTFVGTALTPYGSNPSQTAASGADTQYKFGASGATQFSHVSGQNNTVASIFLAFDQSTTAAGNQVYVIAAGQPYAFDRVGTVLHFSSAAQQSFGGTTGITVEAFA